MILRLKKPVLCSQCRSIITSVREAKTAGFAPKGKATWAETLLLPKTPFPIRSAPEKSEVPFHEKTTEGLYKWQVRLIRKSWYFCLLRRPDEIYRTSLGKVRYSYCTMVLRMRTEVFIWVSQSSIISVLCNIYYAGHAMNKIIKDIINRYHVIRGRKVKWVRVNRTSARFVLTLLCSY